MTSAPPLLEVDLGAGVRAAFTQVGPRAGDRGFNLSLSLDDDAVTVLRRRAQLDAWVGGTAGYVRQVHGAVVHVHRPGPAPRATDPHGPLVEADAVLATGPGAAVAVLVADCVPVLLADAEAGVVGAVHAGRRGLAGGVVQEAVGAMVAAGARAGRLRAAVGPAICGECYEVPLDLQAEVGALVPGTASRTSWGTPGLDLPRGVLAMLGSAGVHDVVRVEGCTLTDERWYSHRAQASGGRPEGRFAGVVGLPAAAS